MTIVEGVYTGLLTAAGAGLVYSYWKLRQLSKFSKFIQSEIDRVYHSRINILKVGGKVSEFEPYPNSRASYDRLSKTLPWRGDFANIVVYYGTEE